MPLGRAVRTWILALFALTTAACAGGLPLPAEPVAAVADGTATMPREVRIGAAEMVIQAVEANVSRDEVANAIAPMLANAPVCMRWPALWIEQARRNVFVVRYDLMVRDWGAASATEAEARMAEFVELGFLSARPSPDARMTEYTLTEAGAQYLSGVIEPGRRPRFCGPAERRLVEITNMEWRRFPCGTLHVQFTHVGDDWPSWATSDATRRRLAMAWPAVGAPADGEISLSRIWYSRSALPAGFPNGALMSACYDAGRGQIVGNDLTLGGRDIE